LTQLEHWGCPWSRTPDGHVNVRAFGGMKIERTWFAADKTGFHMLHTLFQTSIKYPSIKRFDEHFCVDLVVEDGRVQGVVAIEIASGEFTLVEARSVIIATGGAGRVFRENTNGGVVTGDGMALAYRHGVPLRDMEFVQYHPTCMPGTGLLFTEACRGEGGFLVNKDGYRYLQDYGLGPAEPTPRNKAMELGPRDRLSQAFWYEQQKGRTIEGQHGSVVHLDLRHLGEAKLRERLPQIYELAEQFLGVDPARRRSRFARRCTTRWAESSSTAAAPRRCRASMRPANARASASMAPTGWDRIRCPNCSSSARWRESKPRVSPDRWRRGIRRACSSRRRPSSSEWSG
jgi:fumarate reductase flavoprotein subunit